MNRVEIADVAVQADVISQNLQAILATERVSPRLAGMITEEITKLDAVYDTLAQAARRRR